MPRENAARRKDLEDAMRQGIESQSPGPVAKPSSYDDDCHDNKTPGAGIAIPRQPSPRRPQPRKR